MSIQKSTFNEDDFDRKVAFSIVKIHKDILNKRNDINYYEWVITNENHLNNLYELSGLDCDLNIFYNYVYDNSNIMMK